MFPAPTLPSIVKDGLLKEELCPCDIQALLLMAQAAFLTRNDGLFVGSSAAMNCVGAVKLARNLGPGHTIATILCDAGHRCA